MEKFVIVGGSKLNGQLNVPCSKNAILPIISACILTDQKVTLYDVPNLIDIEKMLNIYISLGGVVERENGTVILNGKNLNNFVLSNELTKDIRASVFTLGSLLAKFKKAVVAYPGGCNIGNRPIDIHLNGLKTLGVKIEEKDGMIYCDGTDMKAGTFCLSFPSVGATENIMMSAVFLRGETKIVNPAKEPEIVDLANFINKMGGKILGAGTDQIIIEGVSSLNGVDYHPICDRIIAGTYIISVLTAGGDVELYYPNAFHINSLLTKLKHCACNIEIKNDRIRVQSFSRPISIKKIETEPYPGFPTDLQSPIMTLQTISKGESSIVENLYENRFKQISQLQKMGAKITLNGNCASVIGVKRLNGAVVTASDIRAGASLVIAGLNARGTTEVMDLVHIDRGYEKLEEAFKALNANIKRVKV